jgi:hypothetical protein
LRPLPPPKKKKSEQNRLEAWLKHAALQVQSPEFKLRSHQKKKNFLAHWLPYCFLCIIFTATLWKGFSIPCHKSGRELRKYTGRHRDNLSFKETPADSEAHSLHMHPTNVTLLDCAAAIWNAAFMVASYKC